MCSWRNESQKNCLVSLSLSCVLAHKKNQNTFHFKTPSYLGGTCCWEQLKSQCKTTTLTDCWDKEHTGTHVQLVNRFEKALDLHCCHRDCKITLPTLEEPSLLKPWRYCMDVWWQYHFPHLQAVWEACSIVFEVVHITMSSGRRSKRKGLFIQITTVVV